MTYHSSLQTSADFINALKRARELSENVTKSMNGTLEIFPYAVFYVYYEQYLTIVNNMVLNIGTALCTFVTSVFSFIRLSLSLSLSHTHTTFIIRLTFNSLSLPFPLPLPITHTHTPAVAVFFVSFLLTGFNLWTAVVIVTIVTSIILHMLGSMAVLGINANAVSLVNLVMVR